MIVEPRLWTDPQCEDPTYECIICGGESFGEICERCRRRLGYGETDIYHE